MKKIPFLFTTLLLIVLPGLLHADVPVRNEEFIYSIMAFNGRDYSGTFAGQNADTIYLMADVDNFLSVRKTFVYYWPITAEWRTDTDSLNIPFKGTLEIKGKKMETVVIPPTRYTYYNIAGEYDYNWVVAKEEEADRILESYQKVMNDYYIQMQVYRETKSLYEYVMNQLAAEIGKLRDDGEDVTLLMEELKKTIPPMEPAYPNIYNTPPVQMQEAFIINLPDGEYNIRFINEDGTTMEGSECNLVVFEKRRAEGIGFDVIPGDKWTRPAVSNKSSSVLYLDGSTDIFLRPFFQQEYSDLNYKKMIRNDSTGNPGLMKWVKIQQVPEAKLIVEESGSEPMEVSEKPFIVVQSKGAALGYSIAAYNPEGIHKDKEPSLIAFQIPMLKETDSFNIHVLDKDGYILEGSSRQIRIINSWSSNVILVILALLPMVVIGFVRLRRNRRYKN